MFTVTVYCTGSTNIWSDVHAAQIDHSRLYAGNFKNQVTSCLLLTAFKKQAKLGYRSNVFDLIGVVFMYADQGIEVDKSYKANCYLLTVKSGRKAQRISRALGGYYPDTIQPDDEAIFHLSPTALLVALLAAGKAKSWAREFVAGLG